MIKDRQDSDRQKYSMMKQGSIIGVSSMLSLLDSKK